VPEDGHITNEVVRSDEGSRKMDALGIIGMLFVGFAVLGLFAAALGEDSRPWINDEWRRLY
jgi:hypothetical protein